MMVHCHVMESSNPKPYTQPCTGHISHLLTMYKLRRVVVKGLAQRSSYVAMPVTMAIGQPLYDWQPYWVNVTLAREASMELVITGRGRRALE